MQLKGEGIHIRVIDAYSVQPIDAATLIAAGKATNGVIITVEDHYAPEVSATRSAKPSLRRARRPPPRRARVAAKRPAGRAARSLRHLGRRTSSTPSDGPS